MCLWKFHIFQNLASQMVIQEGLTVSQISNNLAANGPNTSNVLINSLCQHRIITNNLICHQHKKDVCIMSKRCQWGLLKMFVKCLSLFSPSNLRCNKEKREVFMKLGNAKLNHNTRFLFKKLS